MSNMNTLHLSFQSSFSLTNEDVDELTQVFSFVNAPIDATAHFGPPFTQRPPTTNFFNYNQGAYMQDPAQRIHTLEERCQNLEFQVVGLKAECDTLRTLCQDLSRYASNQVNAMPHVQQWPGTASAPWPSHDLGSKPTPQTHPHIKFWNKSDWNVWTRKAKNDSHDPGKTLFLEEENRELIDIKTVSLIHDSMHLAWNDLAVQKCAPFTWGCATASAHDYFHSYMKDKWPLFRLCDNGWKLNELASVTYPGYKRSYLDDEDNLKVKVKTKEMDLDNVGNSNHPGNENSNDIKRLKSRKARVMSATRSVRRSSKCNERFPQKKNRYSTSIYIPSADILFHLMSSGAGKTTVPQLPDIEAESSEPGVEVFDQNACADNTTSFKQDTTIDFVNDFNLGWDFGMKATHPVTVDDNNRTTATINREDTIATAAVNSEDSMIIDPGSEEIPSSTSLDNNTVPTVSSDIGEVKVTHVTTTNNNNNNKVSGTANSDQNPSATNKNIDELTGSGNNDNDTSSNKMPEGSKNKSPCKERPKLTLKKSVRLVLKNPISVESLSEAKVNMPKLPELPTVIPSPKLAQSDKEQELKKRKTKGRMQVPSEKSGRNLCARRWLRQVNKDGTKDDFKKYWWMLTKEQHMAYDTEAESIVHILLLKGYILIPSAAPWKRVVEVGPFKWKVTLASAMSEFDRLCDAPPSPLALFLSPRCLLST
ncbi:hypothetical protein HD554DRAFT_2038685 [Boletus coccyginus]|nr:hypothetical protein HD554DRAFT_2038685 [Boletus coccyginus]